MKYKKLAISLLVILLAASVAGASGFETGANRLSRPGGQKLAPALIDWQQANSNGFGDPLELEVSALEAFNGYLYAGTYNLVSPGPVPVFDGTRIYRSPDGVTWTPVTTPGFANPHDSAAPAILDFVVFGTRLYASTGRGNAAQIWRASNGVSWAPMVAAGFGDENIHDIAALAVYNSMIYAGASSQVNGARLYSSASGDSNTWNPVTAPAATMAGAGVTGFATFGGALYAAVDSEAPVQIWRTSGGAWEVVVSNGFGDTNTTLTGGMAEFGGYLYVGAGNTVNGAKLFRTNGTGFSPVSASFTADTNNTQVEMVSVFETYLYVSVKNTATGLEVWRTSDLVTWEQANLDGFGDSNNTSTNRSHASANFLNRFYVGTSNVAAGGELWRTVSLAPTDILLTNNTVNENSPVNTIIGALSAASPDPGSTFTFSLACAVAGADDASFNILGSNLRTSTIFNREAKSIYNICIRVTDQGLLTFDENFVITVNNVNEAPTGCSLSNNTVDEKQPVNTVVGALSATDPDAGSTFTFSLACAVAGADDASFNILGSNLRTSSVFNFATKSTYNICIRVMDQGGLTYDKNYAITVNVNQTSTLIYLPVVIR
ncbi:MAG: hypothetical protein A2W35_07375 [Chloroflexi bacterium RBG_16_57_11]|nr:MAG: hypothetical protein A2W35_07375 [Chloroflexi bacterium RBG_16_57_11]